MNGFNRCSTCIRRMLHSHFLQHRSQLSDSDAEDRMVQKTESLLSGRFTIVEIEHTPKAFAAMNWLIG